MKQSTFVLVLLMAAALLVTPVAAVNVSFDNATCGIHIQKDIQVNGGQIRINTSDFPETNCSVVVSTNEYTTTPSYYNPSELKVTYSEEYYRLKTLADDHTNDGRSWESHNTKWLENIFYELRRQTILMEKQNELLEEQNGLMRTQMGMKLKCKVAGSINGAYCDEYSWVAK